MTMSTNPKPKGKRRTAKTLPVTPKTAPKAASKTTQKTAPKATPKPILGTVAKSNALSIHGITLNPEEARKAIILAEIIGPPAAKKRRMK